MFFDFVAKFGFVCKAPQTTLLQIACRTENIDIAFYLLDNGVSPALDNPKLKPSIFHAMQYSNLKLTQRLLSHPDLDRAQALLCAVETEDITSALFLLKSGANINGEASLDFKTNMTPLHLAVKNKSTYMAGFLLLLGADVNALCNSQTPIFEAVTTFQVVLLLFCAKY